MAEQRKGKGAVHFAGLWLVLGTYFAVFHWAEASPNTMMTPAPAAPTQDTGASAVFLPLVQALGIAATPPPNGPGLAHPTPLPRQWDPRLDQRGAELRAAETVPGEGYWRLIRATWYDEQESQGRHHIFIDVLDQDGQRIVDLPIRVYWGGGETILHTQAKPGETYAVDFGMFALAPAYGAAPANGATAEEVWGMGLGSIEQPNYTIHSSYGLVWQWTIAAGADTPAPTSTPTPPAVSTDAPTPETTTPTATTPVSTATATPAPAVPERKWDPRLDRRGAVLQAADVAPGQGYWRLIEGVWLDEHESQGRHHIFVDVRDEHGNRLVGVPMRFHWNGGEVTIYTEAKPGEAAAASFAMAAIAPAYGVMPGDGQPADGMWGMGLGSLEQPHYAIQSSYRFVWQWTVQPGPPAATSTPEGRILPAATDEAID